MYLFLLPSSIKRASDITFYNCAIESRRYRSDVGTRAESSKRVVLHGHAPSTASTFPSAAAGSLPQRVFLLSPANASGIRAQMLLKDGSRSELAQRLREGGAPLGEVFSLMSSLYFRGKLSYARRFSNPPSGLPGVLIITPSRGLLLPESIVTLEEIAEISTVRVLHTNPDFRDPLERAARLLAEQLGPDAEAVLLGSVATLKYVNPLLGILGRRLVFPCDFAGRGNMSRGGLLLRCCRDSRELEYKPVEKALCDGAKPRKPARTRQAR